MTTRAIIVPEGRSSTEDQLNVADMLYLAELLGASVIELTEVTTATNNGRLVRYLHGPMVDVTDEYLREDSE